MTTATMQDKETATEYQEFTWQAIKALAGKIGVPYYAQTDSTRNGIGFKANRHNAKEIRIVGYVDVYGENKHDRYTIRTLSWKSFFQTLELFFLKNGIKYEVVTQDKKDLTGVYQQSFIRIIK